MKFRMIIMMLFVSVPVILIGGRKQSDSEHETLAIMQTNAQNLYEVLTSDWQGKREAVMAPVREISATNDTTLTFLFSPNSKRILDAILHKPHPEQVTPKQAHDLTMEQSWRNLAAEATGTQDERFSLSRRASITNGKALDALMKQDVAVQDMVMRLLTIAAQKASENRGLPPGENNDCSEEHKN